jgi:hypothetical protein
MFACGILILHDKEKYHCWPCHMRNSLALLCLALPCIGSADDNSSLHSPSCMLVCSKYAKHEAIDSREED